LLKEAQPISYVAQERYVRFSLPGLFLMINLDQLRYLWKLESVKKQLT